MNAYTIESLTAMTAVELRRLGADLKIPGASKGKKADLIGSIYLIATAKAESAKAVPTHSADNYVAKPIIDEEVKPVAKPRTAKCANCGKRRIDKRTQGADSTLCTVCFEFAGRENEHLDGHHDDIPVVGCPDCAEVTPAMPVAKAVKFAEFAKANGWSALARTSPNGATSIVSARRGDEEIFIFWDGNACRNTGTTHKGLDGKVRKVRNANAAKVIIATAA